MKALKCKSITTHWHWLLSCSKLTSSLKLASVLFPTEICKVTFSTSYKELTILAPWLCIIMHLVHFNVLLLLLHTRMICKQLTESKVIYLSLLINSLKIGKTNTCLTTLQQKQNKFPDLHFIATKLSITFIAQFWSMSCHSTSSQSPHSIL